MGKKYTLWRARTESGVESIEQLRLQLLAGRGQGIKAPLDYGDFGIEAVASKILAAIRSGKRIALYADYDVDGTMSCVSWVWFFQAIGYTNFTTYIPCRFKEGYGVNLQAIQQLIEQEQVELVITMDTGITANEEAAYCKEQGVEFICTDHHMIQPDKMPDCTILNPKLHDDGRYQELCGCGITFVLLRRLSREFELPAELWTDLLALTGLATICDVVPLNSVNHELARLGIRALTTSRRPVLAALRAACQVSDKIDEQDVGFMIGPRINAVGRLGHAEAVVRAFIDSDPTELVAHMGSSNIERRRIQKDIVAEADGLAQSYGDDPILFLGGQWHSGVVGIAASKIAETYWKPTWLFQRQDQLAKGSARSIPGFDVTAAMMSAAGLFLKCGGHKAAGGFSFDPRNETQIRKALSDYARAQLSHNPQLWKSSVDYDCQLPLEFATLKLTAMLDSLRPFGHGFAEPVFEISARVHSVEFFKDKTSGKPKHTCAVIRGSGGGHTKILFFNEVHEELRAGVDARFLTTLRKNYFRGQFSVSMYGVDFEV